MIVVKGLEFRYPKTEFCLRMPEFQVQSSQSIALIGPSGCGKTTFLQLVSGINALQKGEIQIDGKLIHKLRDREKRLFRISKIGFIFQDFSLLEYINVLDNILHPYRMNHQLELTRAVKDRAKDLASRLGLETKLKRYPQQLSQGEKQRTAIARALITIPKLLLADEPTGNLDPEKKQEILGLLLDYIKEQEASLLLTTHDHQLLSKFDRVVDFSGFSRSANNPTEETEP